MGKYYSLLLCKIFSAVGNLFSKVTAFYFHASKGVKQEIIDKKLLALDFDLKKVQSKLVFSSAIAEKALAIPSTLSSLISVLYLRLVIRPDYSDANKSAATFFPSLFLKQEQQCLLRRP
jgi:hypothetical protein